MMETNNINEVDPFKVRINWTSLEKLQMLLLSVTLLPMRLVGALSAQIIAWVVASISLINMDHSRPVTGWRKTGQHIVGVCGRVGMWCCGFHKVKITGKQVSKQEAPVLVVGPHSSFFDGLVVLCAGYPFFVSRAENLNIPFMGKCIRLNQTLFVSREDPDSRHKTVEEITRRIKSDELWPQFLIFPEGTTTNRKALMKFKPGGFIPGCPVQPVLIRYHNKHDTISWTWDQPLGVIGIIVCTLCQLQNYAEIKFLPPYIPSQREKEDPQLYADNVRKVMAHSLNISLCDLTFKQVKEKYDQTKKIQ